MVQRIMKTTTTGQSSLILRLLLAASILLTTITFLLLATPQCLLVVEHRHDRHDDMPLRLAPSPLEHYASRKIRPEQQARQPAVLAPSGIKSNKTQKAEEEEAWEYKYYSSQNNEDNDVKTDISVFDSALHPIFDSPTIILPSKNSNNMKKRRRIRTRLFTIPHKSENGEFLNEPSNEGKQILYDGLQQSKFIDLVDVVYMRGADIVGGGGEILNATTTSASATATAEATTTAFNNDDLWVLDMHHILQASGQAKGGKKRPECETLVRLLDQAMNGRSSSTSQDQEPLRILAIDFADNRQVLHCPSVMKRVGIENYHLAKRSIVTNRQWNETRQFPTSGSFIDSTIVAVAANTNTSTINNSNMHHIAYGVRSDLAQQVAHRTLTKFHVDSPLQTDRSAWDVIHLYERTWNNGKGAYYDNLRTSINAALKFINGTQLVAAVDDDINDNNTGGESSSSSSSSGRRTLITFTGKVGLDQNEGRNFVSKDYVDLMLSSKIHVVAQRDAWTDHYRLTEALTAASLVLCDESIVLAKGLRTGHSLVTYNSLQDLREKIFYYLQHEPERQAIAQRGWEIAMGYHRSWHVMEAVIFGRPQTLVGRAHEIFQRDVQNAVAAAKTNS